MLGFSNFKPKFTQKIGVSKLHENFIFFLPIFLMENVLLHLNKLAYKWLTFFGTTPAGYLIIIFVAGQIESLSVTVFYTEQALYFFGKAFPESTEYAELYITVFAVLLGFLISFFLSIGAFLIKLIDDGKGFAPTIMTLAYVGAVMLIYAKHLKIPEDLTGQIQFILLLLLLVATPSYIVARYSSELAKLVRGTETFKRTAGLIEKATDKLLTAEMQVQKHDLDEQIDELLNELKSL